MAKGEKLIENYEDALFALMMDEVAYQEGQRLLMENEQLKQTPELQISADTNKKCLKTIKREFAKQQHQKMRRVAFGTFRNAAAFAMAAFILYGSAYAAFPEVRINTLNFLIETSDVATSLILNGGTGDWNDPAKEAKTDSAAGILMGYQLPTISEQFVIVGEGSNRVSAWIRYANEENATIYFSITNAAGTTKNVDTENAENIEKIQIHGYEGLLVEKDERVNVTWGDTDHNNFVSVSCNGIDKNEVLDYAESIEYIQQ